MKSVKACELENNKYYFIRTRGAYTQEQYRYTQCIDDKIILPVTGESLSIYSVNDNDFEIMECAPDELFG